MAKASTISAARAKPAGIGHNKPPAETVSERNEALARDQQALLRRIAVGPKSIDDEDGSLAAANLIRDGRALLKSWEASRAEQKEPYLRAGREIDGWFKGLAKPVEDALGQLVRRITSYQDRVEAAKREAAEREAEAARKEAERLARIAARKRASEDDALRAADAQIAAESAADEASAPSADLVRVRSDEGTITRTSRWVCSGWDRAKLDLEALRPYFSDEAIEKAIRALIRAEIHSLVGASIVEEKTALVL